MGFNSAFKGLISWGVINSSSRIPTLSRLFAS